MDDHRLIAIGIIFVIIAGAGISFLTPRDRPPTLDGYLRRRTGVGAGVYSTTEAICVRDGTMISCARCPCTITAADIIPETAGARGRVDASCVFIVTTRNQYASEHSVVTPSCNVTFEE